ncbi:MAG: adenylate/guanylate cyclase domain-containing protein [Alphaproteobacteria bacterium]|nr:adenylate/guanylate cyclase domain-containing protein [Alphaproteobacteria bacterium]
MPVLRKFVTIVAVDCVGFSKHMLNNEETTLSSLNACREIIDTFIFKHGGRIFHTAGDSVLAEFPSTVEAVNCAINFQDAIFERNLSIIDENEGKKLIFRVGIHCDDVIVEKDNIYGNGVNIAARLEAQCVPGQILVSRIVNENVKTQIEAITHAAGTKKLKNISSDFEVFAIKTSNTDHNENNQSEEIPDDVDKLKKPNLCILPFKNMNMNDDSSFLVDGIFEDIITELSMVRQLSIVSRQSSINFVNSDIKREDFINQFNINFLAEGTVRTAGNKVRITISLIETETEDIKWSQKFDRSLDDIFDVQDEIVRSVVRMVLGEIELVSLQRAKRKPTENMSSYEYLLKGKEMHHQFSKDANAEALEMFDRAIESDPNNAQAYAWKACTLGQAFARNYINDTFEELSPVWDNLISTAIKIDPNDFECHRLLSAVYSGTKKYNLSLEHGKKAYDMVPNDPRILQQYGEALLKTGQTTEGCYLTLKALEYDPVPQGQINSNKRKSDAVFACFMDDRIDLGLELAEQISEPSVRDVLYSTCLAVSKTGSVDEYPWLQKVIKASDQNAFTNIIDDMKNIDLVIYNTLLQVYNETILAAFE